MKWLKLSCWLAAWGLWLWLGFGLYRELPRELGQVVCKLPVSESMVSPLGFVGDSDVFAMQWPAEGELRPTLRLFDAWSGREVGRQTLPLLPRTLTDANPSSFFDDVRKALRRGFLFGFKQSDPLATNRQAMRDFQLLDVFSGEWRRLTARPVCHVVLHPQRQWAAVIEGESPAKPERTFVVDLNSGKEIMSRTFASGDSIPHPPFFIASRDSLAVTIASTTGHGRPRDVVEVWRSGEAAMLEETLLGIASCDGLPTPISVSASGRIFFDPTHAPRDGRPPWMDVYDFGKRQFMTTVPPKERPGVEAGELFRWYRGPVRSAIAPTGCAVFRCALDVRSKTARPPLGLYEVGAGRLLWQAAQHESVVDVRPEAGFFVTEQWHELWKSWLPSIQYKTIACRDLESGKLLYRTSAKPILDPLNCNSRRTLGVLKDGSVHRLPHRVNWLLFLFCQTILALPLILLWALLQSRRRRAARRQPAVALTSTVTP